MESRGERKKGLQKPPKNKNKKWRRYTGGSTRRMRRGACVRALVDRVVRHASGSKVRVDVRRGDGRGLVRMLRTRGVEIDDNASSSSSMSAKLDVSVHVASHVLSLCNVAKCAAGPWTLHKGLVIDIDPNQSKALDSIVNLGSSGGVEPPCPEITRMSTSWGGKQFTFATIARRLTDRFWRRLHS